MKKKIKLSLLSFLFASSTLAIILPIVSCSGSVTTNLIVDKGNNTQLNAIGTAIANVGRNGTTNNFSGIDREQFKTSLTASYSGEIKTAIDNYFSFRSGSNNIPASDAIESIALTSNFPPGLNAPINVRVDLKLRNGYTAPPSDLTLNVQIGVTTNITLSVTRNTTSANVAALGLAITRLAVSGATSNSTQPLTQSQHSLITGTTNGYSNNAIKDAIDNIFTFRNGDINVIDAIAGITIRGNYPPLTSPNSNLSVTVSIQLHNGYSVTSPSDLTLNVQIGLSTFDLSVTQGDETQRNNIGIAIARVGNSTATSTGSPLTSEQYERALTATYTGDVKTTIDNYFAIRSGQTTLTDAINRIIVERTSVGALAVQVVNLTIVLKPGYTSSSSLTITNLQIGFGRS